jgi:subtilisin family serine protease
MKTSVFALTATIAVTICAPATTAIAADQGTTTPVIVILKDQHSQLSVKNPDRIKQVKNDQQAIVDQLTARGDKAITQFTSVNAVATSVTASQLRQLTSDAAVRNVIPDAQLPALSTHKTATPKATGTTTACAPTVEPESLSVTHADAAQTKYTGAGLKIGFVADGIDINNPEFIRPDGSHVITDYQDFSGSGTADVTGGGEAFGDASIIAAQGAKSYDYGTELGVRKGCTFTIHGFAPGASMVAIKAYGEHGNSISSYVRGIDYAVSTAHVDVLNESFSGLGFPDVSGDPISLANKAAAAAGVVITGSTGDSGTAGTLASPASNPWVIGVGATTTNRTWANVFGYPGWTNGNITSFSSSGTGINNHLLDLVAPGDGGLAACTVDKRWSDCASATELFSGTSMSAPEVAGAAALVIQAYAAHHSGQKPSPDLVKRILTGTATDLGIPADEQGAGELNVTDAVAAAEGAGGLIPSVGQLDLQGNPGSTVASNVTLTNASTVAQTVTADSRTLGATVFTDDAQLKFPGGTVAPLKYSFTVPKNLPWLQASIAWPGTAGSTQEEIWLTDPTGKLVQLSSDGGLSNYQHVDVHDPVPGVWTAIVKPGSSATAKTAFAGTVALRVTGTAYTTTGMATVTKTIAPGQSTDFGLNIPLAASVGDAAASVQFSSTTGATVSLPVSRRSLIPAAVGHTATFSDVITGSIAPGLGQANGFYFTVPAGQENVSIDFSFPDKDTQLNFILIDPNHQYRSAGTNRTQKNYTDNGDVNINTASVVANRPAAGTWQLVVALPSATTGTFLSEKVTGRLAFNAAAATSTNLPTTVAKGHATAATIHVVNPTNTPRWLFADPRLNSTKTMSLATQAGDSTVKLPVSTSGSTQPTWLVPSHSTSITQTVSATMPVDARLAAGSAAVGVLTRADTSTTTVTSLTAPELTTGYWASEISEPGPFPTTARTGSANIAVSVDTLDFNADISASTGNFWQESTGAKVTEAPILLPAHGSADLPITITATAPTGTTVTGSIFVNWYDETIGGFSELATQPYSYTVK